MKVVISNTLHILNSTVQETDDLDGAVWRSDAAYVSGDNVRYAHLRYEALKENTNQRPDQNTGGIDSLWRKLGATNQHAMLDDFVDTQTVSPPGTTEMHFNVPFNRSTSFALLNVYASSVHVRITDDTGGIFFDHNYTMVDDITSFSAFQYCFYPITGVTKIIASEVPMPVFGIMEVILRATESPALGHVVVGRSYYIGETQYGAGIGELDYSRKDTDEYGITQLIRRGYANSLSLPLFIERDRFGAVADLMEKMRAVPSLWIGDNEDKGVSSLTVFGFKQDFRMVIEDYDDVQATLEINGLV